MLLVNFYSSGGSTISRGTSLFLLSVGYLFYLAPCWLISPPLTPLTTLYLPPHSSNYFLSFLCFHHCMSLLFQFRDGKFVLVINLISLVILISRDYPFYFHTWPIFHVFFLSIEVLIISSWFKFKGNNFISFLGLLSDLSSSVELSPFWSHDKPLYSTPDTYYYIISLSSLIAKRFGVSQFKEYHFIPLLNLLYVSSLSSSSHFTS